MTTTMTKTPSKPQAEPHSKRKGNTTTTKPVLRFSPAAWAKLLYFRDKGQTEIGGFGITSPDDLLLVRDFITVRQQATVASIAFDDTAVADFYDGQIDQGRNPREFSRLWIHSHPGNCPQPSATDEETFARVFGTCDWAILFVIARGGKTYARLSFSTGPGGEILIPTEVDFSILFQGSDHATWEEEYKKNIQIDLTHHGMGICLGEHWLTELESMEPAEKQAIFDDLGLYHDPWDREDFFHE